MIVIQTNRIESGIVRSRNTLFIAWNTDRLLGIPSGKMITDSDAFSFVYLLEEEARLQPNPFYTGNLAITGRTLKSNDNPVLAWGEETLALTGFKED